MQRRQSKSPTPPPQKSVAQLKAERARLDAELARAEALEQAELEKKRTFEGAKVIVPASPSPCKKRARPEDHFQSSRPAIGFRDSTLAGPPKYSYIDSLRAAQPPARDSQFSSNESALPRPQPSSFLAGLAQIGQKSSDHKSRKQQVAQRATGFSLDSSARASSRGAPSPSVDSKKGASSKIKDAERSSAAPSSSQEESKPEVKRSPSSRGQGMTRHAAVPKPKAAPAPITKTKPARTEDEGTQDEDDEDDLDITDGPTKSRTRRADGTLIEKLEVGPFDHEPPDDDSTFETIEPISGIHLKKGSRVITHDQMQDHFDSRYHLSPSLVYSLARKAPGSDHVDVDVVGDFIVIGVLAWKGEVRVSNPNAREESKERKNLRFTLVDLSTVQAAASGTGTLSVMLFESETVDTGVKEDYEAPVYKGGSGGAYEKFWKESVGAVVAILNPQILKPRVTPGQPNIFTITPRSADSMMVIGRAQNLGSCQAMTAKGKLCGDWCDARVNRHCGFHVQKAIGGTRASRPETANTTSNMSSTAQFDRKKFSTGLQRGGKSNYDPDKKIGLLPDSRRAKVAEGLVTYVSAGTGGGMRNGKHTIVSSDAARRAAAIQSGNGNGGFVRGVRDGPTKEELVKERREKERMEKRRKEEVKALMGQDKGRSVGGEYVELANKQRKEKERAERKKREEEEKAGIVAKGKKRRKVQSESESSDEGVNDEDGTADTGKKKKTAFTTAAVRLIGYDPTNHKDAEDEETKRLRLSAISSLTADRPAPKLSAPPGPKVRSGVSAPTVKAKSTPIVEQEVDLPDFRRSGKRAAQEEDSDDDLIVEGAPVRAAVKIARPLPRVAVKSAASANLTASPSAAAEQA